MYAFRRLFICWAVQHISAIPHNLLGTVSPQMLLTPSEHSYSSFVRFPQGVFFLLFNQGLDPMLRGLFSCETRPCRPRLTIRILNRESRSLTNELCSHTERIGYWEINTGTEKGVAAMLDRQTTPRPKRTNFIIYYTPVCLCTTVNMSKLLFVQSVTAQQKDLEMSALLWWMIAIMAATKRYHHYWLICYINLLLVHY